MKMIDINQIIQDYGQYYCIIVAVVSFFGIWIWNEVMLDHLSYTNPFNHENTVFGRISCFMLYILFSNLCVMFLWIVAPFVLIYFIFKKIVDSIAKMIKMHYKIEYKDEIRPGD